MGNQPAILVRGGTVVPMTAVSAWQQAGVLVREGTVTAVAPSLSPAGAEVLDARGWFVLPGFVQAHVHVVQSLARHRAEGLELLRWLKERIWPYEAALDTGEAAAARLGSTELLCGGTTAALDMGTAFHQDEVFEAGAGARAAATAVARRLEWS